MKHLKYISFLCLIFYSLCSFGQAKVVRRPNFDSMNNLQKKDSLIIFNGTKEQCFVKFLNSSKIREQGLIASDSSFYMYSKTNISEINKTYCFRFYDGDSTYNIYENIGGEWKLWKSIHSPIQFLVPDNDKAIVPDIEVVDLNGDDIKDILVQSTTDMYLNKWCEMFIVDLVNKEIHLIDDFIGISDPKFCQKNGLLYTNENCGNWNICGQESYKWEGLNLIPLERVEIDNTNYNTDKNKGAVFNRCEWKNNEWKKIISIKNATDKIILQEYDGFRCKN